LGTTPSFIVFTAAVSLRSSCDAKKAGSILQAAARIDGIYVFRVQRQSALRLVHQT
jgi:hypothetical protein